MKKFATMFLVLLMCLVLALPMGALAEEIPAIRVDLTDPVISMDGTPIMDFTGLGLHLLGALDETNEGVTLQASVTGGDVTALNATAEILGENVLLKLDGMTDLYSAVNETALTINGENVLESPEMAALAEAVTALTESELPDKLSNLIAEEGGKIADKVMYVGTENYELFSGEQEIVHVSLELTAEETAAIVEALMKMLDEDADFAAFMQALNGLAGEDLLEGKTLQQIWQEADPGMAVVFDVYSGETGSAIEAVFELNGEEVDESGYVLWRMISEDYADGGSDLYIDFDLVENDEFLGGAYFIYSNVVEDGEYIGTEAEFGLGEYEGEDFVPELFAQAQAQPVIVDDVETMQYTLLLEADGEAIAFSACGYAENGKVFGELLMEEEDVAIRLSFEGAEGEESLLSGVLTGETDMMGAQYAVDIKVDVVETAVESGVLQADAANAINVEDMTYEQMETAELELVAVLENCVTVLGENVPGVQLIMQMMMTEAEVE